MFDAVIAARSIQLGCIALVVIAACNKEQADPATGSATATGVGSVAERPIDARPQTPEAPPVEKVASKHGYCEVRVRGGAEYNTRVGMKERWVESDYWLSAKVKADDAAFKEKMRKDIELEDVDTPMRIVCQDPDRGLFIRFEPELKKGAQIKHAPAEFRIVQKPEPKPGVIRAGATLREGPGVPVGGVLRVVRFEQGELEATFELDVESTDEPPKRAQLVGKVVYHCAGYKRC